MWSLAAASGHVMADEDYKSAAARELTEEIGLTVDQGDMEFVGKTLVCYGKRRRFLVYYMAKVDFNLSNLDISEREIAEIKIVSKGKLKDFIFENSDSIIDYGSSFFEELIHKLTK